MGPVVENPVVEKIENVVAELKKQQDINIKLKKENETLKKELNSVLAEFSGTKSYFDMLSSVNVSDKIERKNGLSYLSWAYAWGELKKRYPLAYYTIYENENGYPYFSDGKTCWVKTGVTVNDLEHIEYLPIMDYRNKSIALEAVTSFDVNKSIQRSLTKAVARHGLGLYIYAGEDLPEEPKKLGDKQ